MVKTTVIKTNLLLDELESYRRFWKGHFLDTDQVLFTNRVTRVRYKNIIYVFFGDKLIREIEEPERKSGRTLLIMVG